MNRHNRILLGQSAVVIGALSFIFSPQYPFEFGILCIVVIGVTMSRAAHPTQALRIFIPLGIAILFGFRHWACGLVTLVVCWIIARCYGTAPDSFRVHLTLKLKKQKELSTVLRLSQQFKITIMSVDTVTDSADSRVVMVYRAHSINHHLFLRHLVIRKAIDVMAYHSTCSRSE